MRNAVLLATLVFVGCACSLPALAQDTNAPAKGKQLSPTQAIVESWNEVGNKLIAMAEDFPEDKYDYKPNPDERTFADQLMHMAGANYYLTNMLLGQKPPASDDLKRGQRSKAEVVAFVKKSIADGATALQAKGDTGMEATLVDPFSKDEARVYDFAYGFIEHMGEHYGQLVVYYRTAGLVPPASRPKKK